MYNKRVWLNPERKDSTASFVAYDGVVTYKDKSVESRFIEISDCQTKIRLHQTTDDSMDDFVNKLQMLHDNLGDFIEYLKS